MMTLKDALKDGERRLGKSGLRTPRADAEVILCSVLERDRAFLLTHPEYVLQPQEVGRFKEWMDRRARHYPLQYLRGEQEFYGRSYRVSPAVLVPRPETETVVEAALRFLNSIDSDPLNVLEIGFGSGCLGISLVCENSRVRLTAVEISEDAIELAAFNVGKHGCADRVDLLKGDALQPLLPMGRRFHLLVSNPPYGSDLDTESIDPGVLRYEPREAVLAGASGLELYRRILRNAEYVVRPGGSVILEIGCGQRESVTSLGAEFGWRLDGIDNDLAGIERCVTFGRD